MKKKKRKKWLSRCKKFGCSNFGIKNDKGEYLGGLSDGVAHFCKLSFNAITTRDYKEAEEMAEWLNEQIEGRTHEVYGCSDWHFVGNEDEDEDDDREIDRWLDKCFGNMN